MILKTARFEFSLFGINTYVVYDPETLECAIIDPGMMGIEEENAMRGFIARENLKVIHLINTHLHIDHAVGDIFVSRTYSVPLEAHQADLPLMDRIRQQAEMFGIKERVNVCEVEKLLKEGDTIAIGRGKLEVMHVPGHSPGSIVLYNREDGVLYAGDVLFAGSVGRTDLLGGSHSQLIRGIKEKLMTLPDNTTVYPGHGPSTTISREKTSNPFLTLG